MCIYICKYPCGHCYQCQAKKRNDIIQRLRLEFDSLPENGFALFGLLSYSDEGLKSSTDVHTSTGELFTNWQRNITLYVKRLRKQLPFIDISYYIATEYGPKTKRLHHHPIFFIKPKPCHILADLDMSPSQLRNYHLYLDSFDDKQIYSECDLNHEYHDFTAPQMFIYQAFKDQWQYGKYSLGFAFMRVLESSLAIAYVTKYIHKQYDEEFLTYSDNPNSNKTYYRQHLISNGVGNVKLLSKLFEDIDIVNDDISLKGIYGKFNLMFCNFSRPLRYDDPTPKPNSKGSYPLAKYLRDKIINSIYKRAYQHSKLTISFDCFVEHLKIHAEFRYLLSYIKSLISLLDSYHVFYSLTPIYDDDKPLSLTPLPIDFRVSVFPNVTVLYDSDGMPIDAVNRFDFALSAFAKDKKLLAELKSLLLTPEEHPMA